jgi:hypothetical protein
MKRIHKISLICQSSDHHKLHLYTDTEYEIFLFLSNYPWSSQHNIKVHNAHYKTMPLFLSDSVKRFKNILHHFPFSQSIRQEPAFKSITW